MMTHAAWLLLIPAAAAVGWLSGRRGGEIKGGARISRLSNTYFRGLNYLLNEQQDKAIDHALEYEKVSGEPMGKVIAHFHCELAEKARLENRVDLAREEIGRAYAADSNSVRAGIFEGKLELAEGNDAAAIRAFERVARHDIEYLPEIMSPLLACYERRGETARARGFLQEMIEHYPGVSPVLALAQLVQRDEGIAAAQAFLSRQIQQRPSVRGEAALIDLALENPADDAGESMRTLKQITDQLVVRTNSYRCQRCGFGARAHHWQCPSCKQWGTIKPLHSAAGD
jgi:lipopolysaccharide biosynthesis regulator YciM